MDEYQFVNVKSLSALTGFAQHNIYRMLRDREVNGLIYGTFQEKNKGRLFVNVAFFEKWAQEHNLSPSIIKKRCSKSVVMISKSNFKKIRCNALDNSVNLKIKYDKIVNINDIDKTIEIDKKPKQTNVLSRIFSRIVHGKST